jgi:5-carboxymethyl-2-hydroxymuconate isomerase
MPHITVEATPGIAHALEFRQVFSDIHHRLGREGHGKLEDFKSRVLVTQTHLAADDPTGEYIVARLITTHPRPLSTQREMARVVHEMLSAAIEARHFEFPWQCCVLNEAHLAEDYFKSLSPDLIDRTAR